MSSKRNKELSDHKRPHHFFDDILGEERVDRAFEYEELDDCNEHEYLDHVKHVYAPDCGEETTYD